MIQLTTRATIVGSPDELVSLRDQFAQQHFVQLREFFAPDLCRRIMDGVANGEFEEMVHGDIGVEVTLKEPTATLGLLHFVANDQRLFDALEWVTGCAAITNFTGRVYRLAPNAGHYDSWHSDLSSGERLVAMSVNLTAEPFEGGVLEIRDANSEEILSRVANPGLGDAVIFRIARGFEHRVTDVRGDVARTAFAGWFRSGPSFPALLREAAGSEVQQR